MANWIQNISIGKKIGLGLGSALLFSAAVSWVSITRFGTALPDRASLNRALALADFNAAAGSARALNLLSTAQKPADAAKTRELAVAQERKAEAALSQVSDPALTKAWQHYESTSQSLQASQAKGRIQTRLKYASTTTEPIFEGEIGPARDALLRQLAPVDPSTAKDPQPVLFALSLLAFFTGCGATFAVVRLIKNSLLQLTPRLLSLEEDCVLPLAAGLDALSKGDFTVEVASGTSPISRTGGDEFGKLAVAFNEVLGTIHLSIDSYNGARGSLSDLVVRVRESADAVSDTSQRLANSAEESGGAASEIASGSEKLAKGATDAAETMQHLAVRAEQVGNGSKNQKQLVNHAAEALGKSAEGIEGVSASAQTMKAVATEGNRSVQETVSAMQRVTERVEESATKIKQLDQKGQEIGQIVGTIQQIAEQTNLLALNAAIEAARAGEHGRGFAVVAEEVRKLAEQSSASAKQISQLIGSVRSTVESTVAAINETTQEVQVGAEKSERAGMALDEILRAAQTVADQANAVSILSRQVTNTMSQLANTADQNLSASQEMVMGTNSVQGSIENVAAVSEESAAGAQELTASIDEVSAAASQLARMSSELQSVMATFQTVAPDSDRPKLHIAA